MNAVDASSLILNTFVVLNQGFKWVGSEFTVVIAFFAIILMWLNLIYWFRVFDWSSFYIRLITQTIKDMWQFTVFFVMITCLDDV